MVNPVEAIEQPANITTQISGTTNKRGDFMSKSDSRHGEGLSRRDLLRVSVAAGLGLTVSSPAAALDNIKTAAHQEPGNCSTPLSAVANTQYGKVRGFIDGGVFTFKGIPYGADTGGENRWMPAKPPKPWTDERYTLIYGDNCPQNLHSYASVEQ
jgi:para-nitrobenzyl esterase